jgi:hypothetical protein
VVVVDAEGTTKVDQVAADCASLRTRVYLAGGGATVGLYASGAMPLTWANAPPRPSPPPRSKEAHALWC